MRSRYEAGEGAIDLGELRGRLAEWAPAKAAHAVASVTNRVLVDHHIARA